MIHHTAMYFGVAYTYNPYRAITGISGLITPYTEKNDQIKFTGMKTPAGTFQACNVSIQGCPINSAGITAGYYNPLTMTFPLYTKKSFYCDKSNESEVTPITNIFFAYGDISPRKATAQDLSNVFERSYYVSTSSYTNPVWECVLGVSDSPENWTPTGKGATRFSLNQGVLPGLDGNSWNSSDNRIFMYVDRADSGTSYKIRESAKLPEFGYYSAESTFGIIRQVG